MATAGESYEDRNAPKESGFLALLPTGINDFPGSCIYKYIGALTGNAMKLAHMNLALFVAVLALPMTAFGQYEAALTAVVPDDEAIEDIVVVGQKSVANLRRDVFRSEEGFYALYNKLNDDQEYDVRCFYEAQTGTRVKNHVCRAKFVTNAYAKHASRNRGDLTRVANQDANPVIAEKSVKFQEKLETLIAANPELQAALDRYNSARARFLAEREGRARN